MTQDDDPTKPAEKCKEKPFVYARIVGYFSPVREWNDGKKAEFFQRKSYDLKIEKSSLDKSNA